MFFSHMFGGSQSYLIGLKLKFLGMFSMQYAKNNFMLCEFSTQSMLSEFQPTQSMLDTLSKFQPTPSGFQPMLGTLTQHRLKLT